VCVCTRAYTTFVCVCGGGGVVLLVVCQKAGVVSDAGVDLTRTMCAMCVIRWKHATMLAVAKLKAVREGRSTT
jgi:hypothetical protein